MPILVNCRPLSVPASFLSSRWSSVLSIQFRHVLCAGAAAALLLSPGQSFSSSQLPSRYAGSFEEAKQIGWRIFATNRVDQYCGCTFSRQGRVDLGSCGYQVRRDQRRAGRIEWEHVVPASNIGELHACNRNGGRQHCLEVDQDYRNAHNDLHNLIPVVGEVNAYRSNYDLVEVDGYEGQFGRCDFKIDTNGRQAEPPQRMKGDVARIYMYMHDTYGIQLSGVQQNLYAKWNAEDPVDAWEFRRDSLIKGFQGNSNPYVTGEKTVSSNPFALGGTMAPTSVIPQSVVKNSEYSCSTMKSCGQMSSCDEAMYQLNTCGNQRIDGNKDGVPCQSLCR